MKFIAQVCLVVLLALLGGVFALGGLSLWHVPHLPAAYAREVPEAVAGWKLAPATPQDCTRLGPLVVDGQWQDKAILAALGAPDRWEVGPDKCGIAAYYALGVQVLFRATTDERIRLVKIVLGNPNATSAQDPLVKACPIAFTNGLRLGAHVEEVNQRLRRAFRVESRLREHLSRDLVLHIADDCLVGVELLGCTPGPMP